ncbi:MAG: DUF2290 domain-containing protein [Magnetococcales bacterium]|nr:DUF2290 domain-containing protein [Magnetococcales bacterium]
MSVPEEIFRQINKITADLIGLSLCDDQNFPSLCDHRNGICEVGIGECGNISYALKNVSYHDIYREMERTRAYNVRMIDGALIHMMYRFSDNQVRAHRLSFFPSPDLEEFQNNPDVYLEDEIYAEVVMRNIVPFPFRFDYDCSEEKFKEIDHPKSHLTLGQYQNCRIPVSAPVTPYYFIEFILKNFYNTAYLKYCDKITPFAYHFERSITNREMSMIYIEVP